jgi:hypothetical protein
VVSFKSVNDPSEMHLQVILAQHAESTQGSGENRYPKEIRMGFCAEFGNGVVHWGLDAAKKLLQDKRMWQPRRGLVASHLQRHFGSASR